MLDLFLKTNFEHKITNSSLESYFRTVLSRSNQQINSVIFIYSDFLDILTFSSLNDTKDDLLLPNLKDSRFISSFIDEIVQGQWGKNYSLFGCRLVIHIPYKDILSISQPFNNRSFVVWSIDVGSFQLTFKKKDFNAVSSLFNTIKEQSSTVFPEGFLQKFETKEEIFKALNEKQISSFESLVLSSSLCNRYVINNDAKIPILPCLNVFNSTKIKLNQQIMDLFEFETTNFNFKLDFENKSIPILLVSIPEFLNENSFKLILSLKEELESKESMEEIKIFINSLFDEKEKQMKNQKILSISGNQTNEKPKEEMPLKLDRKQSKSQSFFPSFFQSKKHDQSEEKKKFRKPSNEKEEKEGNEILKFEILPSKHIGFLNQTFVSQKLSLSFNRLIEKLSFNEKEIIKLPILSAQFSSIKDLLLTVDNISMSLSIFNLKTKEIYIENFSPLFQHVTNISLSQNSLFFSLDYEFGLVETYRILYKCLHA